MTHPVSNWNLFANPVFRRYAVSSLRPLPLLVTIMVTQILAAFMWFVGLYAYFFAATSGEQLDSIDFDHFSEHVKAHAQPAATMAWSFVIVLQALLSYIGGTARVATGVAAESQTGMMDAFRLTPVSPFAKLSGQLFGLPLHSTVLSLLLMPWAFLSALIGHIPADILFRVYLVFWTGAIMHHALGLTAGTFIRQKVLAGTLSQVSILVLHFVLPGLGFAGLGMIGHFSLFSAIGSELAPLLPNPRLTASETRVDFFDFSVSTSGFNWLVTLLALGFLVLALRRRWIDSGSQMFGKIGTVLLVSSILFFTCGEMLPQIAAFPDQAQAEGRGSQTNVPINDGVWQSILKAGDVSPEQSGNWWLTGLSFSFGLLLLALTSSLAPSEWARVRARRQGRAALLWDDGRAAWGWVAATAIFATAAWTILAGACAERIPALGKPSAAIVSQLAAALILLCFLAQSVLLSTSRKVFLLGLFLVGLVPYMVFSVIALASAQTHLAITAVSPLSLPGLAVSSDRMLFGSAFGLHLIFFIVLQGRLIRKGRKRGESPAETFAAASSERIP